MQTDIEPGGDPGVDRGQSTPVAVNRANPVVDSLPFTGADLMNLLVAGVLLTGFGVALRLLMPKDRPRDLSAR